MRVSYPLSRTVRTLDRLLAVRGAGYFRSGATATVTMIEETIRRFGA